MPRGATTRLVTLYPLKPLPPRSRPRFGYESSLDGLRGLAVLTVVGYHIHSLDPSRLGFLKGGFFGVELFFVVSGYLITTLLLQEHEATGRIDLVQFWKRRARRLLPALFAMLIVTALAAVMWRSVTVGRFKRDVPWALFYVSNWGQIVDSGAGYFAQLTSPPLLRHLWSLAVEEQWYLVWPLAFGWLIRTVGRRLGSVLLILGLLCAAVGIVAYDGTPGRANFVYLSTVTRASGLLIGAALAMVWKPWQFRSAATRKLPVLDGAAVAGVLVIAVAVTAWANTSAVVYRGGMLVVSLVSALLIAVAMHPGAVISRRVLQTKPLTAIGRRSYGLYLWHWPILVLTDAVRSVPRLLTVLALIAVVTEASFRGIEEPFRRGLLTTWWTRSRQRPFERIAPLFATLALLVPLGFVVVRAKAQNLVVGGEAAAFELKSTDSEASTVAPDPSADVAIDPSTTTIPTGPQPVRVVVVGDSQAQALSSNLPTGIEKVFTVTDGAVDGCGVWDDGTIWSSQGFKRPNGTCVGWSTKWAASASGSKAEVALVVIGAWDVFDIAYKEGVATFNSPAWDEKFVASLQKGVSALAGVGTKAALLEVACMNPIHAAGAAVPPLPERGEAWRTVHVNQLLRRVAAANPGQATFLPGPQEWCNNPVIAADKSYRWDGVHVYKPGAKLIFESIAANLLRLAGR